MASESQKKEFAAAREKMFEKSRIFDISTPKLEENDAAQTQQNVLNKLRERFADVFLTEDADQRNNDIYYCLQKGVCKDQERKLVSCFMKADAAGADVSECCNEEISEMKTCINKCLYKLMEKKMDFLRLISDIPYYYSS
ncbi:hypothetical protein AVEN_260006-1 [Araneus ventricosus]|uniref:Uncharacterized protein n=1 Tax=Araneus ventricosus TaxID=182803 RepID=A0A4Y2H360_ARAVE|nr:hypothetical protein AVEN_260006-1 [Araneus ventricosus]